ncbi:DUF6913 domain-containing protein [Flavobacterium sp. '19STA2R22 D10 B1']|uniref:DUF6913 domain-containing protein n=1 Tax=Flavobacterium aerium TaxID=3037261 RepID=UPI00278C521B|nr:hypothetical protein [Flavobacterium sp. '19STA2R22 D10 B1']
MFIKFIKDFSAKKILKKSLFNVKDNHSNDVVRTIGLLIDETYFLEKEALIKSLVKNGIPENKIKVLVYRDRLKKNEEYKYPTFSNKQIGWDGQINNEDVQNFVKEKFDMLISYYDTEKLALMLITNNSKANFKVGFSTIDKRLNHFMINTNAENYEVFTTELFKYLRILNKV